MKRILILVALATLLLAGFVCNDNPTACNTPDPEARETTN